MRRSDSEVQDEPQPLSIPDDLYFIRIDHGPVKIGRARNVKTRLRMLQCGSPYDLTLVGVLAGHGDSELTIHAALGDHRMRGEWFEWTPEVEEAVTAMLRDGDCRFIAAKWFEDSPLYRTLEAA